MGNYFFVELDPNKIDALYDLRSIYIETFNTVDVIPGDINIKIETILSKPQLKLKEPVFCLLDQHTTECHWATVEKLAKHPRPSGYKIEQFYFLATGWLHRVFGGSSTDKQLRKLDAWWGDRSWEELKIKSPFEIVILMIDRFKNLGYRYVTPWPIFEKGNDSSRVMYYMIHASDHDKAPQLMESAYHKIIETRETNGGEQLTLLMK